MGTKAGPGQYLSQNVIDKFVPRKGTDGTMAFNAVKRKPLQKEEVTPGPQSYSIQPKEKLKESGNNKPF